MAMTDFDPRVVPRFLYSREVIARALARRLAGDSRERAAVAATADGQLDPGAVKRWEKRLRLVDGILIAIHPPVARLSAEPAMPMLAEPVGHRRPDPQHRDQWERSPPTQP